MLMVGDGDLIVREDLLGLLLNSGCGVVWDVRGNAGAGKSVLLRQVQQRAGPNDVVVLIEMQDYHRPFEFGEGAVDGVGGLGGELRRFGQAVAAVIDGLLDRSATRAAVGEILEDIAQTVRQVGKLAEPDARARAAGLVERLQEELNRLIMARTATVGQVYLLFDAFDEVLGSAFGEWFLRLLDGLDGSVTAVARRVGPDAAALPEAGGVTKTGELRVLPVDNLTEVQVREHLVRRLGTVGGDIAEVVYQFTGGHALAVGLTADLARDLRRRAERGTPETVLKQLAALPGRTQDDDPDVQVTGLVNWLVQSAREHDPEIAFGLDCLWPVRRFDFPLLEFLLGAGNHQLAAHLVSYSFVEPRSRCYVVHDQVRALLERTAEKPEQTQEVHRRAEEYYRRHTEDVPVGYKGWFRYSDANWQVLVREWLYHVYRLSDSEQVNGRRWLAKLFFDSFWWWGNYIRFPFCEELVTDWSEMAGGRDDAADTEWGSELRGLYVRYPKGWRARGQATPGDWEAVRKHLEFFRDKAEVKDAEPDNRHMRQLRGQLGLFLGLAEYYLDPRSSKVTDYFRRSRELFISNDNAWSAAWVSCHEADAALGRGDLEGAIAAARQAWDDLAALGDDDFELVASLHRIHADAAWARGEHGLALDLYARAALCAYQFQVDISDPDIAPIVEYTQAFMIEMHERAAERLSELHRSGKNQAVREACARIRAFFAPYWRAVAPSGGPDPFGLLGQGLAEDAVAQLFPPAPESADLHRMDTQYTLTAAKVLYRMRRELAKAPGVPLSPAAGGC